jgi:hypothetical protein
MLEGGGEAVSVTLLIAYAMNRASRGRHAAYGFWSARQGISAGRSIEGVAKMSFLDKAKDFIDKHDEQVDKALDKVGEQVDRRTGGKYTGHIDKAVDEAQRRTGAGDTHP